MISVEKYFNLALLKENNDKKHIFTWVATVARRKRQATEAPEATAAPIKYDSHYVKGTPKKIFV